MILFLTIFKFLKYGKMHIHIYNVCVCVCMHVCEQVQDIEAKEAKMRGLGVITLQIPSTLFLRHGLSLGPEAR